MLVLTRKAQETIKIGDAITITVIKTKGKTVRLGIEAPADISVLRGELAASIDADNAGDPPVADSSTPHDPSVDRGAVGSEEAGEVSFARVPRSKVATVLPNLLGEAGPLREMLMQRSGVAS